MDGLNHIYIYIYIYIYGKQTCQGLHRKMHETVREVCQYSSRKPLDDLIAGNSIFSSPKCYGTEHSPLPENLVAIAILSAFLSINIAFKL
jgi:hypothetical protein